MLFSPALLQAQSVTLFGALSNFDVLNDTGQDAHGFEIELQGIGHHVIPYAVSGAFALREYTGISRMTKDLDVFLTAEDSVKALHYLRKQGFQCEVCDPVWLAKAHRDGYFVDLITGMSNAVLVVEPSWIERARPATIVEIKTRVLAPEELLASKLFVTRRERFDGADIAHVIYGTRGKIEWERCLAW